jgi:phosphohistidine swiveling domain-containing protein
MMAGSTGQAEQNWVQVGSGVATNFSDQVEGRIRDVLGAEDVLALVEEMDSDDWGPTVVLVHEAGGTTLGPLLGEVVGVVSTKGTLGAHIALLTKEYGCPCIVGTTLSSGAEDFEYVRLATDGTVWGLLAR